MICKLVTYGPTREEARKTMISALDEYVIRGVSHNISLLRAIMGETSFIKGDTDTGYLKKTWPDGKNWIRLDHTARGIKAISARKQWFDIEVSFISRF